MSDDILFYEKSARWGMIGEVILNRPHALNALSLEMCQRFSEQLQQWNENDDIQAVVVKGIGERAFCAGGDIRQLYENKNKNPHYLSEFFWHEYRLNALIHHFSKPYFSLLHHITMGGGAGISIHGKYRIATENLTFAMPETKIGFYPDIGASYFLNLCPGYTGLYLGLTGNSINAVEAYELGLVTHLILQDKMKLFENTLYENKNFLNQYKAPTQLEITPLKMQWNTINDCFSKNSVEAILHQLDHYNDWSKDIEKQIRKRCPTSLKITFEAYHRAKKMNFNDIIQMNFDMTQQFLKEKDFFEGIRSVLIDKDQSPQWEPMLSDEKIQQYFSHKGKLLGIV